MTSFQTVSRVRRKLKIKKAGHAGTLDQFASGLLLILTGRYTRLVEYFTDFDKVYRATFEFGKETDTLDPEGRVIAESGIPSLSEIETALPSFFGKISQQPPQYSAVHIDGERAYRLALKGREVEMPSREIEIFDWKILGYRPPFLDVQIHCSKGTYIRSLARDLGRACGSCAYVTRLERLSVGGFSLSDAVTVDALSEAGTEGLRDASLAAGAGFTVLSLKEAFSADYFNGKPIAAHWFDTDAAPGLSAVFCRDRFAGMIEKTETGIFRYRFVLAEE